jgi:sulfotransferase family protein
MTLKVIGSGLGRTGTMSLKHALEQLGCAPCHHMVEVFARPQSVPLWIDAAAGKPQWNAIYEEFGAAVDYPTALYWRELAAHYPDAKIIHTVRDPERWFESTQETIFAPNAFALRLDGPMKDFFAMFRREFGDKINDRAFMIDYFERHTVEVIRTIPPERLLIFEASQGWEPLCKFLGVPVPPTPYPSENTREEFKARAAERSRQQS